METETIAAIATARGQGGIGVIRISGEDSIEIADKIFVSYLNKKLKDTPGYTARYGRIFDKNECIDEVVALVFRAPHSYTGENVVEISCHGGVFVTEQVLKLVIDNGAIPAGPGEFTKRAFLNGKMDLTQAEAVMDIIGAKGKEAARVAISLRDGALSQKINKIKKELIAQAAHLAAFADYPEDDIPQVEMDELINTLNLSEKILTELICEYGNGKIIRDGIDTVIVGKPNVGKSTLMNFLSGFERCIVTDIPGTTRDIIEETVSIGNVILKISDTAGIRETSDPVESIGVEMAKNKISGAQLVLAVFDASKNLDQEDISIIENLKDTNAIAIVNKMDLETKIDCKYIEENIKKVIYCSAISRKGLNELEKTISEMFYTSGSDFTDGILYNSRQYAAAKMALECIVEAKNAIDIGMTLDAVDVSIESAIEELLKLTGERVTEKVTNEVFSHFCVGK
ncbi:MAG: tRNA modification GTPase MnmE [Eubacteriales bacterium SKADARSKE-1]|nr:tRNA modification GTPase MnmE [Eubacteriales bacterium SKADARSKE-1]